MNKRITPEINKSSNTVFSWAKYLSKILTLPVIKPIINTAYTLKKSSAAFNFLSMWLSFIPQRYKTIFYNILFLAFFISFYEVQSQKITSTSGKAVDMTRMAFETVETAENLQLQILEQKQLIEQLQAAIKNEIKGSFSKLPIN